MATLAHSPAARPAFPSIWAGRILSGLGAAFLLLDAGMKLAAPGLIAANTPPEMGWSVDPVTVRTLGTLLLIPTLLYIWPRTAVLGALLITGYLGGTVATHMRVADPLFSHTLFGVYLAVAVWGGLWLRMPELRALLPLVSRKD